MPVIHGCCGALIFLLLLVGCCTAIYKLGNLVFGGRRW